MKQHWLCNAFIVITSATVAYTNIVTVINLSLNLGPKCHA